MGHLKGQFKTRFFLVGSHYFNSGDLQVLSSPAQVVVDVLVICLGSFFSSVMALEEQKASLAKELNTLKHNHNKVSLFLLS